MEEKMAAKMASDYRDAMTRQRASSRVAPALSLQRKGSSFLEEPVIEKVTERGEAEVTVGCEPNESEREGHDNDSSVNKLRYAVSEMQGWRSHMEDRHALNPRLHLNKQQKELLRDHHLFAVFDGHGGEYASHFCGDHFVSTLISQRDWKTYLKLAGKRDSVAGLSLLKSALTSAFLDLDVKLLVAQRALRLSQLSQLEELVDSLGGGVSYDVFEPGTADHRDVVEFSKQPPPSMPANAPLERSGSTGVVVLITPTHILCANAGDSRAVLSRRGDGSRGEVLPLSFDHKPVNDVEACRVEEAGGFVRNGRVDGDLAVSRSFGDFGYKDCARVEGRHRRRTAASRPNKVAAHPDIVVHARDATRDEFVVLACDGIWDRLTNRDCADLVRNLVHREGETDVGLVCEEIIDTALELDSRDNMTACAAFFPAAMMHRPADGGGTGADGGVLLRRRARERQWGDGSTPAKRAHQRLEERRRRNRELAAAQNASKRGGTARRPRPQKGGAPENSRRERAAAAYVQGRKHKATTSPPATRAVGRPRSGKSSRTHAGPAGVSRQ